MTTTGRHGVHGQATGTHFVDPGRCNPIPDGTDREKYAAWKVYKHFADLKEAYEIRDEKAHWYVL